MKQGVIMGVLVGIVAVLVVRDQLGTSNSVYGQLRSTVDATDTMVVDVPATNGGRFVVILDTRNKVMGSYHINPENGQIALRSVRNYQWDLNMSDFNGTEPKPGDVRAIVEQR